MREKVKKRGGKICDNSSIKNDIDRHVKMYLFNITYFMYFLLNFRSLGGNMQYYIDNINDRLMTSCDSLLLNFISICCKNCTDTKLIEDIAKLNTRFTQEMTDKCNDLRNAIESDQSHDFWTGNRCENQLTNCHKIYSTFNQELNEHLTQQISKNRYSDINNLSNEPFDYVIIDTKPHGIAYSLINDKTKMNMITNVIDSAGCSFDDEEHHYKMFPYDLELFILNLGFGFYQSYFNHLAIYNYHIYLTISLKSNKETFMKSKRYYINIHIRKPDGTMDNTIPPYEASGGGSNSGEFSVSKICKMLHSEYNNYKFPAFIYKALEGYFNETTYIQHKPSIIANITSSMFINERFW